MRTRNHISFIAVCSAVMLLSLAAAAGSGAPWPEAHSGAYLGVQVTAVTSERASALKLQRSSGAVIAYVDRDGPACRAGLQENDVVVAFDGSKVDGPQQLQNMIHVSPPQKTVTLTIVRNGLQKDVKVTLGSWNVMSHANTFASGALASPAPPRAYPPDVEMPAFTLLSARHGLVVESLSPQLADFFGVKRGQGVLVRSVENGSPASAAGLKAGDVILKVNNEDVHDMSDWQRGMRVSNNKVWVLIWRDKKEQNFVITLPGPGDSSRLVPSDILDSGTWAQLQDELEQLKPQIESRGAEMAAQLAPTDKEMQQMRRDVEKSMKLQQKEMEKMSREMAKAGKFNDKQMEQLRQEMQRSMPSQKDFDAMKRQLEQSMPKQEELDKIREQMQASMPSQKELEAMKHRAMESMPSQKELDEMRRQIEDSMKNFTPQMQQEMEQLQKQMEQQKLDMQQLMQQFQRQEM